MESVAIEIRGSPLDPDLLKSFEQFSLESSYSNDSSDHSESEDEETRSKQNDLEQKKNLSVDHIHDSKNMTLKCTDKISEINFEEKDKSGKVISADNKETEESIYSSPLLKDKEFLRFFEKTDVESTFYKSSNDNCEINSKKKNIAEKLSFAENLESVENQLSSLTLRNNQILNKYLKIVSGVSAVDESDSDEEEQEALTVRGKEPINKSIKEHRTTPFSRNHAETSKHPSTSNNSHTCENISQYGFYDVNRSHNGYNSIGQINNTSFERYGIALPSNRTFHSGFPTPESLTNGTNQIFNHFIPYANQIVNGGVSCAGTDQVVDGNSNDTFSEEINETFYFDNLKERIFSGSAVTDIEKETFLDSHFETLTPEEVDYIIKSFQNPSLNNFSNQNHVALTKNTPFLSAEEVENFFNNSSVLNGNTYVASTDEGINRRNTDILETNQRNFHQEPVHGLSESNDEASSLSSSLSTENVILENPGHLNCPGYLGNKPSSYSNWVIENVSSINSDSLSSEYISVSNEIEELVKMVQNNVFPFEELDDNAIQNEFLPEEKTVSKKCNVTSKKKDSKRSNAKTNKKTYSKRKNQAKSPCKIEGIQILCTLRTEARNRLFESPLFCKIKCEKEDEEIRHLVQRGELGTEEKPVIFVKKNRTTKYRGTNLHLSIRSENIERIFCLVEWHKRCHNEINTTINLRDILNKTVLDYAKEKLMTLVSDYLEENNAKEKLMTLVIDYLEENHAKEAKAVSCS